MKRLSPRVWTVLILCLVVLASAWLWQRRSPSQFARQWTFAEPAYLPNPESEDLRDECRRVADALLTALPESTDARAVSARLEYSLGHSDRAKKLWLEAIEIDPDFANAHFALGVIAKDAAQQEEAIEWLESTIRLAPFDPHAPPLLAEVLIKLSRFEEAIEVLGRYMSSHESSPQESSSQEVSAKAVLNLGHCYRELDQLENARQTFEAMVKSYPDDSSALSAAYYSLFRVYTQLGQPERAAKCRVQFEKHKPVDAEIVLDSRNYDDIDWLKNLLVKTLWESGQAYHDHSRHDAAEEVWQRAASLDPQHADCRLQLLALYERQQRHADGLAIVEQLCESDAQNPDHWLNAGVLQARLGQTGQALQSVGRAVEMSPENPQYRQAHEMIRGLQ